MRPGGSTPDRSLRTVSESRRLTKTTGRTRSLERRITPDGGGTLQVGDGTTTVTPVTDIEFTGATVTDGGGGIAAVAIASGGDYVLLDEQIVGASNDSITFADISQAYRHLRIVANLGGAEGGVIPAVQWNGNTDSGYVTVAQFVAITAGTPAAPSTFYDGANAGVQPSAGLELPETDLASFGPTLAYANLLLDFPYYTCPATTLIRQAAVLFNALGNVPTSANYWNTNGSGYYPAGIGAPITTITLTGLAGDGNNFEVGSLASLYGIK